MKTIFYSHENKTQFHMKGFAISFVFKIRVYETRKWPTFVATETSRCPNQLADTICTCAFSRIS